MRYGIEIGRGVAAMDHVDWGWWYEENLDTTRLDISDPFRCVVGQRFGGKYKLGLLVLFGAQPQVSAHYGFAPGEFLDGVWSVLTQEWVETIEQLRRTRGRTSGGPGWLATKPPSPVDMDPRLHGWFLDRDEACTRRVA
jgi:hypothetical protein